jgi:putative peptide zinc metalloprotease protein
MSPALGPALNVQYSGPESHPTGVLLQDFNSGKVFRFGPTEALAIRLMDGQRTLFDIYMQHVDEVGPISPYRLGVLYEALEAAGMLASPQDGSGQARQRPWWQRLANPFFSIPHSDAVVEAVHGWLRPLVSPLGGLALLAAGFSGVIPWWRSHPHLWQAGLPNLDDLILLHPSSLLVVYALQMLATACHELAHGVTCKHFGGRVPRMGMMWYLASFIFFCDTTSAWSFPGKSQRILVSLAGPLVSFAFLGGSMWAAGHFLGTRSFWEPVFLLSVLLFFFGLVMNFNPFIRMDAYYMLMDLTGISNLREKSFRFLGRRLLGRWLPANGQEQGSDGRRRAIFWLYGLLGTLVTTALFIWPFIYLTRQMLAQRPYGGGVIIGVAVVSMALFSLSHKAVARLRLLRHREYKIK